MSSYPYFTEPTHDQGTTTAAPRTTAVSSAEGRLKIDIVDKIFLLEPRKHPLISLLTNVGKTWNGDSYTGQGMLKKITGNPEFSWLEDHYGGRYAKVSGTYGTGAGATVTVKGAGSSSAYIFTVGDVVINQRTGERMLVATVASATTITITRSFGSTAATAGADSDGLFIVGNVNEENASFRNVNTTRSEKLSNYTQIFRRSIAVSNTEKASELYGGADLPYFRAKKATEHGEDIEKAFLFSEKNSSTGTNGHPMRSTGGVLEFIESGGSYTQDQGGMLTAPDFNTFLREGFTYAGQKTFFLSGIILQTITEIARGQVRTKTNDTTYGMRISEWITPFGNINLINHPFLIQDYAGYGLLLDLECFRYRYMKDRDTKLLTNIQAPGVDGQVDEYLTECGLQRIEAAKCSLLKGVE